MSPTPGLSIGRTGRRGLDILREGRTLAMKKVVIIGSGGAGKSTLARQLGQVLKLPIYHLDALHWKSGWVPTPHDEWEHVQRELVKKDEWIIEGNYGRTLDIRLGAADTILFLDFSRRVTMYRILKRRVMYHGKTRPDLAQGCPERLNLKFIAWVWQFRKRQRPKIVKRLEAYAETKQIIILRKPSDVARFVDDLSRNEKGRYA